MRQNLFSRRVDALCYVSAWVLFLIAIPLLAVDYVASFVVGGAGIMMFTWQGYRIAALSGVRVFPLGPTGLPLSTISPSTFREAFRRLRAPAGS
jgi:hypothetical protein